MGERRLTAGSVFRAASGTDASMTPRPERDTHGVHRGLSAHVERTKTVPVSPTGTPARKHRVVEIDVGALRELRVFIDDETGHVSIRPVSDEVLIDWASSRNRLGEPHRLTREVQEAIIDQVDIWQ